MLLSVKISLNNLSKFNRTVHRYAVCVYGDNDEEVPISSLQGGLGADDTGHGSCPVGKVCIKGV